MNHLPTQGEFQGLWFSWFSGVSHLTLSSYAKLRAFWWFNPLVHPLETSIRWGISSRRPARRKVLVKPPLTTTSFQLVVNVLVTGWWIDWGSIALRKKMQKRGFQHCNTVECCSERVSTFLIYVWESKWICKIQVYCQETCRCSSQLYCSFGVLDAFVSFQQVSKLPDGTSKIR